MTKPTIGIIGAGAWGTALAQTQAQAGRDVLLWAREKDVVAALNSQHENTVFLPGVTLHENIRATGDLKEIAETDLILLVTPAQHARSTLAALKEDLNPDVPVVICAKGMEIESGKLLSTVAEEEIPGIPVGILTGPTFAAEIARGLPCAVTIAAKDKATAQKIRDSVACRAVRPYVTEDIIGTQIGGAVKNVIAIACGIVAGRKLGESGRAALMTRGLAEMARLSSALGGRKETLMGMCGIGDLMLTASSMQSRNFSLGFHLGEGRPLADILAERSAVTEGVHTARAVVLMAEKHAVDMPVSAAVNKCLTGTSLDAVIADLLERPLRAEVA